MCDVADNKSEGQPTATATGSEGREQASQQTQAAVDMGTDPASPTKAAGVCPAKRKRGKQQVPPGVHDGLEPSQEGLQGPAAPVCPEQGLAMGHCSAQAGSGVDQGSVPQGSGVSVPASEERVWDPQLGLEREFKQRLGAMAKLLIDRGRWLWLCERLGVPMPTAQESGQGDWVCEGASSRRVAMFVRYVDESVSGENKMLLVRV